MASTKYVEKPTTRPDDSKEIGAQVSSEVVLLVGSPRYDFGQQPPHQTQRLSCPWGPLGHGHFTELTG